MSKQTSIGEPRARFLTLLHQYIAFCEGLRATGVQDIDEEALRRMVQLEHQLRMNLAELPDPSAMFPLVGLRREDYYMGTFQCNGCHEMTPCAQPTPTIYDARRNHRFHLNCDPRVNREVRDRVYGAEVAG